MFFSYKYLKLRHHKHGTETLKKKSSFLIKLFFLSLVIFKIHFWLCQVFIVLASSSFCSNRAMNSPEKLSRGMVGDWHFDASFGQSRGLSLFFFFWLCWASFCCTWAFSSCSKEKQVSSYLCAGFSLLWLLSPEDSMSFFCCWLCWASFCCAWPFSSYSKGKRLSSYLCAGFSLLWLLLLQSTGFRAQAQYLCCTGLVALRHVVSSQTRDQTWVLCIGR